MASLAMAPAAGAALLGARRDASAVGVARAPGLVRRALAPRAVARSNGGAVARSAALPPTHAARVSWASRAWKVGSTPEIAAVVPRARSQRGSHIVARGAA